MAKSSTWRRRSSTASPDVPAGHVAVRVGSNQRRFVLRLKDLNHPIIRQLLRHAEEEYGFPSGGGGGGGDDGPITIPCDEDLFADVFRYIASSSRSSSTTLEDFCRLSGSCLSRHIAGRRHGEEALPLLRDN